MTNIKEKKENKELPVSFNKNSAECAFNVVENINMNKRDAEELLSNKNIKEDLSKHLLASDETPPKICKKSTVSKKNNEDDTLRDLTNAAINIATQLRDNSTENISSSVEHAFAQFIAASLQKMEEPERTIRRNKIFQDLTIPLEQLQ